MTVWHIIEIILFIVLFLSIFIHKRVMENLEDRIIELEEKLEEDELEKFDESEEYETDRQTFVDKIIETQKQKK